MAAQGQEQESEQRSGAGAPLTFLAALGLAGVPVASIAEGALAKLLALPLAMSVAWLTVLLTRRARRPFHPFRQDRLITACGAAVLVFLLLVAAASLSSAGRDKTTTVVQAAGSSSGGAPDRREGANPSRGGYSPANRPTYECDNDGLCESGVDHVVFNSYVNTPSYGDERPFLDAKSAENKRAGGFRDRLGVNPGDLIKVRAYINNNADTLAAQGTRLKIELSRGRSERQIGLAWIFADNASPTRIDDTVQFDAPVPVRVEFDTTSPPQITYRPHGTGRSRTKRLASAYFQSDSVLSASLGIWYAGFGFSALITATVRVT